MSTKDLKTVGEMLHRFNPDGPVTVDSYDLKTIITTQRAGLELRFDLYENDIVVSLGGDQIRWNLVTGEMYRWDPKSDEIVVCYESLFE